MNRYTKRRLIASLCAVTLFAWCLAGIRLLERL